MAKVMAVIMAVIGLFVGIIYALMMITFGSVAGTPPWIMGIGIASIVIFPLLAAIAGFIHGAILAIFYNFAAEAMGGIDLDFQ